MINELIREYLVFNGLRDTLSVFIPGDKLHQQQLQHPGLVPGHTALLAFIVWVFVLLASRCWCHVMSLAGWPAM